MTITPLTIRFSSEETAILCEIFDTSAALGNAACLEFDLGPAASLASFLTEGGSTWLCVVKTRTGVQVFKNEAPEPYWTGPSVSDWKAQSLAAASPLFNLGRTG